MPRACRVVMPARTSPGARLLALLLTVPAVACGRSGAQPPDGGLDGGLDDALQDAATPTRPFLGDYSAAVLQPAGADGVAHIDIAGTLDRLDAAHVSTYAYVVFGSSATTQAQWDDLPAFLD